VRRPAGTLALALSLVASALAFGLPSLLVPGIALALLVVAAIVWTTAAARGARVAVRAERRSVEEGEPLRLAGRARLPRWAPPATLTVPPLARVEGVGARDSEHRLEVRIDRRGRHELGAARLSIRDPLGLAERSMTATPIEVLVLPRITPVRVGAASDRGPSASAPGRSVGPELELDALRAYRPGAPASRIHWPTVARTGTLVERRFVADEDSDPLVVLDLSTEAAEGALDRAVRAAASLCVALARGGGCRVLLPGDRRATRVRDDLRAWPALHVRLALARPLGAPVRLPSSTGTPALYWVAATDREPPHPLIASAAPERWHVTPSAGAGSGGSDGLTVAGCTGRRLTRRRARAA
jgi:uncharacterized protein (DUF58 family)